jgi:anti-anti-sigma factor
MALAEPVSSTRLIPRSPLRPVPGAGPRVVSLRGDHDVSTQWDLALTLARAISDEDSDLVVELRDVTFMSASAIGLIVRAATYLERRGRRLTVRAPSPCARRAIDVCGLTALLERSSRAEPLVARTTS